MSGWIKLERALPTDPRILTIASRMRHAGVTPESLYVLAAVGALAKLWSFADEHIRPDDTLDCGVDEINQVIGIAQFCDFLPPQWLQVLDTYRVHLPDFLEHNGIHAAKRALNAERSRTYRKTRHAKVTRNVALDQDRDLDKEKTKAAPAFDPQSVPGLDTKAWAEWVEYRAQRKPAIKPASMAAAAKELADFGEKQAQAVQHSKANGYQGLFLPKAAAFVKPTPAPTSDASTVWAELNARAQAMSPPFRRPDVPRETSEGYRTALAMEELRRHGAKPQSNGAAHP